MYACERGGGVGRGVPGGWGGGSVAGLGRDCVGGVCGG